MEKGRTGRILFASLICAFLMTVGVFADCNLKFYDGDELVREASAETGKTYSYYGEPVIKNGSYLAGWTTEKNDRIYKYTFTPTEDMTFYALWRPVKDTALGENAYLGLDEYYGLRPSNGYMEFFNDAERGKVVKYVRGSSWASVQIPVKWEVGRRYKLKFYMRADEANSAVYCNLRYYTTTETSGTGDHGVYLKPFNAGQWTLFEKDLDFTAENHVPTESMDFFSIFADPYNGKPYDVYISEPSIIPYYKISYDANGGCGAPEDYFTLEKSVTPDSAAIPERKGFEFGGWALKNGSANAVSSVEVNGDVTLYAIWTPVSAQSFLKYTFADSVKGSAYGSINIYTTDETEDYTSAQICFADDDGILSGYTPLCDVTIADGAAYYNQPYGRAFPKEATRLCVTFKKADSPDISYWYTIPESKRMDSEEKPLFTVYSVSDIHLANDYWPEMTVNRANAVKDIQQNVPDLVIANGDLIDNGVGEKFYTALNSWFDESFNSKGIPAIAGIGNHEYDNSAYQTIGYDFDSFKAFITKQTNFVSDNYGIKIKRTGDNIFYSATVGDYKFIMIAVPYPTAPSDVGGVTYRVTDEQLKFLDEELYDAEESGKVTFVISHVGFGELIPFTSSGIQNPNEVAEILNRHENVFFASGHTHSNLGLDSTFVRPYENGRNFTHYNEGCLVWASGDTSIGQQYEKEYSTGQYIEIYSDKVLIKARKFMSESKFVSSGLYIIETKRAGLETPEPSMVYSSLENGSTVTALDNGNALPDGAKTEWIVNGNVVSNDAVYTVKVLPGFGGRKLMLRITYTDGAYASCVSEDAFPSVKVTYDLNGGYGVDIPEGEAVVGEIYTPYSGSYVPKFDGKIFMGWSTSKDASRADISVEIKGDTTLYAVYSDDPKFYFENMSGWIPNGNVAESHLKDGILYYDNSGKSSPDLNFEIKNLSFAAEKYPIVRLKAGFNGTTGGDSIYFATAVQGYSWSKSRIPLSLKESAQADGMKIFEIDITSQDSCKDAWTGNIISLRYDPFETLGANGMTDYLVFTDKLGIFKADLTVTAPKIGAKPDTSVTLSEQSQNFAVTGVKWDADGVFESNSAKLTLTLTPNDGYEFTTSEDMLYLFTLNGEKFDSAAINSDGTATLTYGFVGKSQTVIEIGNGDTVFVRDIPVTSEYDGKVDIIAAVYGDDGRLSAAAVSLGVALNSGSITVKSSVSGTLKLFAFSSLDSLKCIPIEY